MQEILSYYLNITLVEWIAVFASLAYVYLAAKLNIWCWPAAFVSTILYTALFYEYYLFMDSLLQIYYLIMAGYGLYSWKRLKQEALKKKPDEQGMQIQRWTLKANLQAIGILTVLSVLIGWFMDTQTQAHFAYVDSATTVFAVFATYLVTQKVLENWLYWVVIDCVSIYVYLEKGLTPTAFLFLLYTLFAIYGYVKWRNVERHHELAPTGT